MTVNLKILVPDETTNYILNPAFRYDTTGWTAAGSTLTRVLDQARWNIASMKVVTNGAALREGCYYRVNALSGISDPITVSIYVRGNSGGERIHIRLIDNPTGMEWVSDHVILSSERWQRIQVSGYITGSNDVRLYVETDGAAKAITFFVDGAQMERKPYATTYCDGDQPGCRWNVISHSTISTREAYTRQGGKWISLAGPCRENDDIYVTVLGGLGMAKIQNQVQSWALSPGSFFQGTKILDRSIQMSFTVKKPNLRFRGAPDLSGLHELRQQLIDVIKPDLTAGSEPFLFSYNEGDRELFLWLRYESGLEGSWDVRNSFVNSFGLRFIAVDPTIYEDDQEAKALGFKETELFNYVAMRKNGVWSTMNGGFNNKVYCFAEGPDGKIYAGGDFTVANNSLTALSPMIPANRIAYWDGEKWNLLSSGANGVINAVDVAPNGDVYVTGNFTSIGGVACNYVAKWNGTIWSALGTGLGAFGRAIKVAPNGFVYVGGTFTTAGGIAAYRIAYWDGAAWHQMGAFRGVNSTVMTIAIKPDGTEIYFGGSFSDENTNPGSGLNGIAIYYPATNLIDNIGAGVSGVASTVYTLGIAPSGKLYAGGDFSIPGWGIAAWNGAAWETVGGGLGKGTDATYSIAFAGNETFYAQGAFSYINGGDNYCPSLTFYNGSTYIPIDFNMSVLLSYQAVFISSRGDVFHSTNASAFRAKVTLVTNSGTQSTSPKIYIKGAGYLLWLENYTTKKRIYFNMDILANEEIFIDLGQGKITSTVRGDLLWTVIVGSDISAFNLMPGENKITALMINDVAAQMYLYYTPIHWSIDACVDAEALV